jgi:hypothetical protein
MKWEIITFALDYPDSNGCGGINGYHIIRGFNAHVDINNDPNSYILGKIFQTVYWYTEPASQNTESSAVYMGSNQNV